MIVNARDHGYRIGDRIIIEGAAKLDGTFVVWDVTPDAFQARRAILTFEHGIYAALIIGIALLVWLS